jgi:hypothetical protein
VGLKVRVFYHVSIANGSAMVLTFSSQDFFTEPGLYSTKLISPVTKTPLSISSTLRRQKSHGGLTII